MAFQKRLQRELSEIKVSPPENCTAGPVGDSISEWTAQIFGPIGSPYEGGIFNLSIKFPQNYPFVAPKIKFTTKVYHPNIDSSGNICLDILKDQWSPALSVPRILLSICSLLTDPNPNDPLMPDIANEYKENKLRFEINARDFTNRYANGNDPVVSKFVKNPEQPIVDDEYNEDNEDNEDSYDDEMEEEDS